MPRRNRSHVALAVKSTELALAVPQVMAHRLTRMAIAGPVLSSRDRSEFWRMGSEKTTAFGKSWHAMMVHAMAANRDLTLAMVRSVAAPDATSAAIAASAAMQGAALGMLAKGIAPIHRTATANAKRLRRTKLR